MFVCLKKCKFDKKQIECLNLMIRLRWTLIKIAIKELVLLENLDDIWIKYSTVTPCKMVQAHGLYT